MLFHLIRTFSPPNPGQAPGPHSTTPHPPVPTTTTSHKTGYNTSHRAQSRPPTLDRHLASVKYRQTGPSSIPQIGPVSPSGAAILLPRAKSDRPIVLPDYPRATRIVRSGLAPR